MLPSGSYPCKTGCPGLLPQSRETIEFAAPAGPIHQNNTLYIKELTGRLHIRCGHLAGSQTPGSEGVSREGSCTDLIDGCSLLKNAPYTLIRAPRWRSLPPDLTFARSRKALGSNSSA
jgi:hypothetical protein